uniref:Uncharacterized protein n=1 Tax=Brugia malayi TaxID=6279 RepID=A8PWE9_BRUMA
MAEHYRYDMSFRANDVNKESRMTSTFAEEQDAEMASE